MRRSATRCATWFETRIGRRPTGRVNLLAQPRTFGWLANPLAVYYCWDEDGRALDAIVLEVTNTPWGERQWYVLDGRDGRPFRCDGGEGDARLAVPSDGRRLPGVLEPLRANRCTSTSRSCAPAPPSSRPVSRCAASRSTRSSAVAVLLRHPLMPLRVSAGIYRKALGLFLARVAIYRHPQRRRQEVRA